MTYKKLINITKGLLLGDNQFPNEIPIQHGLIASAFNKLISEADALKLFTFDINERLIRQGPGSVYVRHVRLPDENATDDSWQDEQVDIDDELCYPLSRYIAAIITRDKMALHTVEAQELIRAYNSKVEAFLCTMAQKEVGSVVEDNIMIIKTA